MSLNSEIQKIYQKQITDVISKIVPKIKEEEARLNRDSMKYAIGIFNNELYKVYFTAINHFYEGYTPKYYIRHARLSDSLNGYSIPPSNPNAPGYNLYLPFDSSLPYNVEPYGVGHSFDFISSKLGSYKNSDKNKIFKMILEDGEVLRLRGGKLTVEDWMDGFSYNGLISIHGYKGSGIVELIENTFRFSNPQIKKMIIDAMREFKNRAKFNSIDYPLYSAGYYEY